LIIFKLSRILQFPSVDIYQASL